MADAAKLARARNAFERKAWTEACALFEVAEGENALAPDDLERFATAAYLTEHDELSETLQERAHHALLERGDLEGGARSAFWLAFGLQQRGAHAPAAGWLARAERILDQAEHDSVVRGYLLIASAIRHTIRGDAAAGHDAFTRAAEIATRFADRDLAALACHGRGRALIYLGRLSDGAALLDEAMAAVLAGDVSPVLTGDIYCSVLEACQETFDLRRAYEWTMSLARWCASQPDLVRYRGECLLYRAEIMQLRGQWSAAAQDARLACDALTSRPAAGAAFYRLGEIHRMRGEFTDAEAAYTRANEGGRRPQPGLSLLRLAQGHIESAAASIRGVLADVRSRPSRARALAAAVEILIAARDTSGARSAATELGEIARASGASLLSAASAHAMGAVLLAEGDAEAASVALRQAWEMWRDLEMPYEEAHTCLLIAAICERRADADGRRLELDRAQQLFDRLQTESGGVRMAAAPEHAARRAAGTLSERELQVLQLLAAGNTNREIGEALFISERTVARHVSNIFDKLAVSTRAGATACAYQRNLISPRSSTQDYPIRDRNHFG